MTKQKSKIVQDLEKRLADSEERCAMLCRAIVQGPLPKESYVTIKRRYGMSVIARTDERGIPTYWFSANDGGRVREEFRVIGDALLYNSAPEYEKADALSNALNRELSTCRTACGDY